MPIVGELGNDYNTKLLLHFDAINGSTNIIDASLGGGHIVSVVATAQIASAQSKFGATSLYLDGGSDYITIPSSPDWYFGTEPFTIDMWCYFTDPGVAGLYEQYIDEDNWIRWARISGTQCQFSVKLEGSFPINYVFSISGTQDDTWYHFALIRGWGGDPNVWAMTVDGVWKPGGTDSSPMPSFDADVWIGWAQAGLPDKFDGYIDELRITKGVARYTEAFTPPTRAYKSYNSDNLNMLLIHCDGVDGENDFADASGSGTGKTVTVGGSTYIDMLDPKFGTGSIFFDKTNATDKLSLSDSGDWFFGGSNFTIDFWYKTDTLPAAPGGDVAYKFLNQWTDVNNAFQFYFYNISEGLYRITWSWLNASGVHEITGDWNDPEIDTWYHIAIVRGWNGNPNDWALCINGQTIQTATDSLAMPNLTGNLDIGWNNTGGIWDSWLHGNMEQLRISKGIARWTAPFAPPTSPYVPDQYTMLLLRGDGVEGSQIVTDTAGRNVVTANDAENDTAQKKFGTASVLFDGVGDSIYTADHADFTLGVLPFTIDMWVRFASLDAQDGGLIGQYQDSNDYMSFDIYWPSPTQRELRFLFEGGGDYITLVYDWADGGIVDPVEADKWYHVAVVRGWGDDPLGFALCIDGVAVATDTDAIDLINHTGDITIGETFYLSGGSEKYLTGWLDEIRVTVGDARWTEEFSPPSVPYPDEPLSAYFNINSIDGPSYIMGIDPAAIVSVNEVEPQ
jgi:hypothetical protein